MKTVDRPKESTASGTPLGPITWRIFVWEKIIKRKRIYIFGAVMPLIILGIIPIIVGIAGGNFWVMLFGIVEAVSACGDLMVIKNITSYVPAAKDVVYVDHPTEAGSIVFERA